MAASGKKQAAEQGTQTLLPLLACLRKVKVTYQPGYFKGRPREGAINHPIRAEFVYCQAAVLDVKPQFTKTMRHEKLKSKMNGG